MGKVRRCKTYTVQVARPEGKQLGLILDPVAASPVLLDSRDRLACCEEFLIILRIEATGVIPELNQQFTDRAIRVHDWVTEINNARGYQAMIKELQTATRFNMAFVRQFRSGELNR